MFQIQQRGFEAKVHGDVLCGHLPEFPLETLASETTKYPVSVEASA